MARHKTWVNILSDLVRDNPRTSAMIAFNLGVWAGQATQKRLGKTDLSELPAKLVDMMPSMKEMSDYMPALPSPIKALKGKPARSGSRKATVKVSVKTSDKRRTKRGAAKRKAA
jgi:hypothetical protein